VTINLANLPGREKEALQARRWLAEAENNAAAWFGLGAMYGAAGCYKDAVEAADRAIAIDRSHAGAWRIRAMNLDQMRRSEEAVVAWEQLDKLTSKTSGASDRKTDDALQAVMVNPESAEAWKRLALAYRLAGKTLEAFSVAQSAIEASPRIASYTVALVEELLNSEPQGAATFMEYLVTSLGSTGRYQLLLGAARLKAGDLPRAIDALSAACELDQTQENYWYALGKALERQGNKVGARSAYVRAIGLKPSYRKARLALERLEPTS
jgi:Flp pilus assembly protein TadD